jgi:hypothetical protein
MKRILLALLVLLAAPQAFSQQQQPQGQNPPYATPPKPDNQPQIQQPPQTAPKDQDRSMANQDIESQLNNAFSNDPGLSGADVQAAVDDQNITLTGTVQSAGQRDRALALSQTYARYRNIVDKIKVE